MTLNKRRSRLEALLLESAPLWRPATFRERRPAWCANFPDLAARLLALDEPTLAALSGNPAQAAAWLSPWLPALDAITVLTQLPPPSGPGLRAIAGVNRGIPSRKVGQIDAFAAAVGPPRAPLVEWCAGKGHLGRRFLMNGGDEALAVERDATLCAAGEALARGARLPQRFLTADVLAEATAESLRGSHAVALHACGDLHRRLVESVALVRAPALDVAPCCYHLTADATYRPLVDGTALALDRNALKLAVTETVTASPRRAAASARASAWKLAFVALRESAHPASAYQPFRPVPATWLSDDFPTFLAHLADRESHPLPAKLDLAACEAVGWQRHHESRRLQLVRHAFRRALEVWLLCDFGVWLESQGYTVSLREFCPRPLTPRNLLLSARLA